jgi:hypothetical protein
MLDTEELMPNAKCLELYLKRKAALFMPYRILEHSFTLGKPVDALIYAVISSACMYPITRKWMCEFWLADFCNLFASTSASQSYRLVTSAINRLMAHKHLTLKILDKRSKSSLDDKLMKISLITHWMPQEKRVNTND